MKLMTLKKLSARLDTRIPAAPRNRLYVTGVGSRYKDPAMLVCKWCLAWTRHEYHAKGQKLEIVYECTHCETRRQWGQLQ